jgi:hypothetical protein
MPATHQSADTAAALTVIHAAKNLPALAAKFTALKWVFLVW